MAKNSRIPYGVSAKEPSVDDAPWTKLTSLAEYLEDQPFIEDENNPNGGTYAIPPELARWLGNAIKYANRDESEFLRRLGLTKSKGPNVIGRRICELEDQGLGREAALAKVLAESDNGDDEKLSRSKLQRLRDDYLSDKKDAVQVWVDNE